MTIVHRRSPAQGHLNMLRQSFNHQFQQQQVPSSSPSVTPGQSAAASLQEQHDNQLKYLMQAVTTNAAAAGNTPRFRSQTDALLSAQMSGYENVIVPLSRALQYCECLSPSLLATAAATVLLHAPAATAAAYVTEVPRTAPAEPTGGQRRRRPGRLRVVWDDAGRFLRQAGVQQHE